MSEAGIEDPKGVGMADGDRYESFPKIMRVLLLAGDKVGAEAERLAREFLTGIEKAQLSMMADYLSWKGRESVSDRSSLDILGIGIEEENVFLERTGGKEFDRERKDFFQRIRSLKEGKVILELGGDSEKLAMIGRGAYARVTERLVKKSVDFPTEQALRLRGMALSLITNDAEKATGTVLPLDWKNRTRKLIYTSKPDLPAIDAALSEFVKGFPKTG